MTLAILRFLAIDTYNHNKDKYKHTPPLTKDSCRSQRAASSYQHKEPMKRTCIVCDIELEHTNPPRLYCDSDTCTRFKQRRWFKKHYYVDKERQAGGTRLLDLAWLRLVQRMVETCKQEGPCHTCTVTRFCDRRENGGHL